MPGRGKHTFELPKVTEAPPRPGNKRTDMGFYLEHEGIYYFSDGHSEGEGVPSGCSKTCGDPHQGKGSC